MSNTPTGSGGVTAKYVVAAVVLSAVAGATIWLWRTRGGPYVDTLPPRLVASAGLVAVAAAVLALYLWRRASLWRLRRAEHAAREALLAKAGQAADEANAKLVGLVAVTLEWAVRAELVREDVRDVEEYMLHLAKPPRPGRAPGRAGHRGDGQEAAESETGPRRGGVASGKLGHSLRARGRPTPPAGGARDGAGIPAGNAGARIRAPRHPSRAEGCGVIPALRHSLRAPQASRPSQA
jgi:hypothetical protein